MYEYMYICIQMYMCMCMYVFVYECMYVYMYEYVCIYVNRALDLARKCCVSEISQGVVETACDMQGGVENSLQKFGQETTAYVSKHTLENIIKTQLAEMECNDIDNVLCFPVPYIFFGTFSMDLQHET